MIPSSYRRGPLSVALLLGVGLSMPALASLSRMGGRAAALDLPQLPSAITALEQREERRAACGAFCGEPLKLALRVGLGAGKALEHTQDAWGVPEEGTDFGTSGNRYLFTSHRYDTETELYYAGGRCYSPTTGRFITQDNLGLDPADVQTWNLFQYANDNPTRYTDPTGHWSWEGFTEGVKALPRAIAEPVLWVYDTTLAIGGRALGIPTDHLPLKSGLAERQLTRVEQGQSGGTAALKGAIETPLAVFTAGTTAFAQGQYEAYEDFSSGEITIDQYDRRLSQIAGGQAGSAAIGMGLSRASGRTWTGRAPGSRDVALTPPHDGVAAPPLELPNGSVINLVRNAEGIYVPDWEVSSAMAMTGRRPLLALPPGHPQPLALTAGPQPLGLLAAPSIEGIIAANYQRYYNEAALQVVDRFNRGRIRIPAGMSWPTILGQQVDAAARARLQNFLSSQGIAEGSQEAVSVNRWLRDPSGSGRHRIPDLLLRNSRQIFDGTIGHKALSDPQAMDFATFSGGYTVNFITPQVGPLKKLSQ